MLRQQPRRRLEEPLGVFINLAEINPVWPGHSSYPWSNTVAAAYTSTPIWIVEFGTGNTTADVVPSGAGSEGHTVPLQDRDDGGAHQQALAQHANGCPACSSAEAGHP